METAVPSPCPWCLGQHQQSTRARASFSASLEKVFLFCVAQYCQLLVAFLFCSVAQWHQNSYKNRHSGNKTHEHSETQGTASQFASPPSARAPLPFFHSSQPPWSSSSSLLAPTHVFPVPLRQNIVDRPRRPSSRPRPTDQFHHFFASHRVWPARAPPPRSPKPLSLWQPHGRALAAGAHRSRGYLERPLYVAAAKPAVAAATTCLHAVPFLPGGRQKQPPPQQAGAPRREWGGVGAPPPPRLPRS